MIKSPFHQKKGLIFLSEFVRNYKQKSKARYRNRYLDMEVKVDQNNDYNTQLLNVVA